jgi:hypothetical protein
LKYFAEHFYENYVYINFEEDIELSHFFDRNIRPQHILDQLALHFNKAIIPEKTLIIFDEIQACPNALNSLKYFHEKANQYHIVAAGSLLGVALNNTKGFPVGQVDFLDMKPMSFFEFLSANEKEALVDFLKTANLSEPITLPIHHQLIDWLKIYFFVGGMPEAVKIYIENHDYEKVRKVQMAILNAYAMDFSKHAEKNQVMKIISIWESIPAQLAKENKKFKYSTVRAGASARDYEEAMIWLASAGLIYRAHQISTPRLPLSSYGDHKAFKIYMLDIGLLGAMSRLAPKVIVEANQLFMEFKGALTENYVAEELITAGNEKLFYWTSGNEAEVDFVIEKDMDVFPLEVKAGTSTRTKSLSVYDKKYNPKKIARTNLLNFKQDNKTYNYPLYAIGLI